MLYTKLFGLMGVTYILEILSWAIHGPTYYWYLTDAINSLRGVFIFLIFCCKKKVLCAFLNSFLSIPKKMRSNLSSNTASTKTNSSCTTNNTNSIQLDILSSSARNTESESNNWKLFHSLNYYRLGDIENHVVNLHGDIVKEGKLQN